MLFDYVSATEFDAALTLRRAPLITGLSGIAFNSIAEKHRLELTGACFRSVLQRTLSDCRVNHACSS